MLKCFWLNKTVSNYWILAHAEIIVDGISYSGHNLLPAQSSTPPDLFVLRLSRVPPIFGWGCRLNLTNGQTCYNGLFTYYQGWPENDFTKSNYPVNGWSFTSKILNHVYTKGGNTCPFIKASCWHIELRRVAFYLVGWHVVLKSASWQRLCKMKYSHSV